MATTGMPAHGREGEDALLLREFAHRAMNDLAVARSAVALARRAVAAAAPDRAAMVLDDVGGRLDGAGDVMRLLARPAGPRADVGAEIAALCRARVVARPDAADVALDLDLPELWADGALARRVSLVAAELLANALRHGLAGRGGSLSVRLSRAGRDIVLEVADRPSGLAAPPPAAGTGLGGGIVAALAAAAGGRVILERGASGAVATLRVPAGTEGVAPDVG